MGDKRKQKRTTKKTSWENMRSWVGAVLCIAIIVVIATYVAKLVPGSSAWDPNPTGIDTITPTPWGSINPVNIIFGKPIQLTGNPDDPWEDQYHFSETGEFFQDISGNYILFSADTTHLVQPIRSTLFLYKIKEKILEKISLPGDGIVPFSAEQGASMWGDNVVICFNYNIYLYKINSKELVAITNDVVTEGSFKPNKHPDIYKNLVVWSRKPTPTSRYQIVLYDINDINNNQSRLVDPDGGGNGPVGNDQLMPLIFGTNVVWLEPTKIGNQNYDLLIWYDMKNTIRRILEMDRYSVADHDVYEDQIVWRSTDSVDGRVTYIKEFQMSTMSRRTIIKAEGMSPGIIGTPRIWKGLLIYNHYNFNPMLGQVLAMIDTKNQDKSYNLSAFGKGSSYIELGIDGSESAFIYPGPPYEFKVAFDGDHINPRTGSLDESNIYLIEGVAY